ncbi:hypothetical protein FE251_09865 [Georgenia wutianyii]|uniref:Transposase n=1 Tax=Georgenia wutianyii TaxID=2585135 RepID=A0ABX5VMB1_9MICO|nr:hypothetical protein [Georgenia wutianyii]QDB79647.1 hypothetical protein FE251_09865 [Georgenia wutianyii]
MADTDDDAALAGIARDLYALLPAEFVTARNSRAAEVRRAGERALATRVKVLPKPSVPAWAVGLVAREEPDDLDTLGELGAELRVAQASANPLELRALGKRRRQLAAALTRTAARLAEERGVPLSAAAQEQVELTWQAVVIEPAAERAVRSLLLVRTLAPGDLGGVALDGALAVPVEGVTIDEDDAADDQPAAPPRRRAATARTSRGDDEGQGRRTGAQGARAARARATGGKQRPTVVEPPEREADEGSARDDARETRRAERDLRARERVAEQARADREEAQEELARVEARVLQVATRAEELRRELENVEEELEELDEERAAAQEEREDAEDREATALRAVEEARGRLAGLAGE